MTVGAGSIATAYRARLAAAADVTTRGRAFCHRLAAATDVWIGAIAEEATARVDPPRFTLVAVGGYGRGELAPQSDIDLILVHDTDGDAIESLAARIWYPIWDAGLRLGHAVRTVDQQIELATWDLDSATALLTARPVYGDPQLGAAIVAAGEANWDVRRSEWLMALQGSVRSRQAESGDVAYLLEPDLKNGHGGIRDVQSLWWAEHGGLQLPSDDDRELNDCYDTLLRARVALHQATDRPGDVLRLQDQDAVAAAAGWESADHLMAELAAAGRTVAWVADEAWGRVGRRTGGPPRPVAPAVVLVDGEVELVAEADPSIEPAIVVRVAIAAARHEARIGRRTLDRLAATVPAWPDPWPTGALDQFVAFLLEGHRAIPVLEALDQRGLISRMLPEWEPVRSRPQRNAYHRYTVDRHLWEATANAARLVAGVSRPDLLVLGTWFHDLGKGYPGDHSEVGVELVGSIGPRMGLARGDVEILQLMVRHHLLLPDVAVRRDLSDPQTLQHVAAVVGNTEVLELLRTLTIADSIATGPAAWGPWKADLVDELTDRVALLLGGASVAEATWTPFPDAETVALMAKGDPVVVIEGDRVVVAYPDRTGMFSRIAGVLALHGVDVVSARAHSDEPDPGRGSMAAAEFLVAKRQPGFEWERLRADILLAIDGKIAIAARLAEKARSYRRRRAVQAADPGPPWIVFQDAASRTATVVEVHATTKIGILHVITKALNEVGLDIRHASVQTVGLEVIDTFYVRDWAGERVTDPAHRAEIERAVLHAINRLN